MPAASEPAALLDLLLHLEALDYAIFDAEARLQRYSPGLPGKLLIMPVSDLSACGLYDLFPEFIGHEAVLEQVRQGGQADLKVELVHRPDLNGRSGYVTLAAYPLAGGWLVTARDASAEGFSEQRVMQQRNELRLNILQRERAEAELSRLNQELELRVAQRTEQLSDANTRLRALSNKIVTIQEAERRQIARELHDEIGQLLTGLNLLIGVALRQMPEALKPNLQEAQAVIGDLVQRVRSLSLDLRPAMLDDLGLLPALFWLFERYTRRTQIQVDFKYSEVERRFDSMVETTLFRLVQESLTNVARYAGVEVVHIQVWSSENYLYLHIEDAGRGFDPEQVFSARSSNGLAGMRERVSLVGGELTIDSFPAAGTRIDARFPLNGVQPAQSGDAR